MRSSFSNWNLPGFNSPWFKQKYAYLKFLWSKQVIDAVLQYWFDTTLQSIAVDTVYADSFKEASGQQINYRSAEFLFKNDF